MLKGTCEVNLDIAYRLTNWPEEGTEFQMSRSLVLKHTRCNLNTLQLDTVRMKRPLIIDWTIT